MYTTTQLLYLLAALVAAPSPSYAQDRNEVAAAPAVNVLATVNGAPITTADVQFFTKGVVNQQAEEMLLYRKAVLENLITQELICQKATQLGIDADPMYQEQLRRAGPDNSAFKRKKLTEAFWRHNTRNIQISDAQTRDYYTANIAQFRTVYTVSQILSGNEDLIKQDLKELEQGVPFEKVAAKQFSKLPASMPTPWVMRNVLLIRLPADWKGVASGLQKGQRSDIIRGQQGRFWIIRVDDRHEDGSASYASVKPLIINILQNEKAQALSEKTIRELRDKATIVYAKQLQSKTAISRLEQ